MESVVGSVSGSQFEPFLQTNFDASEFASRALCGSEASAQSTTQSLRDGIDTLDREIRVEVLSKQDSLMAVVKKLCTAEERSRGLESTVSGFQQTVEQLKVALSEPCDQIRSKTRQLKNLRDSVDLLRNVNHRLKVTQRLRAQIEGGSGSGIADLAQAAKLLTELKLPGT